MCEIELSEILFVKFHEISPEPDGIEGIHLLIDWIITIELVDKRAAGNA